LVLRKIASQRLNGLNEAMVSMAMKTRPYVIGVDIIVGCIETVISVSIA